MKTAANQLTESPVRQRVSAGEWEVRVDLAACYRLAVHYRMTDLIYTHISARVPGPEHHFLINAFGLLWDEMSASTLVKVTLDGDIVDDPTGNGINRAGFVIHSAVHRARPDVACVIHTHTAAGIAVSAQENGLLPISQHAMRFWNNIGYHDYEGARARTRRAAATGARPRQSQGDDPAQPRPADLRRVDPRGVRLHVLPRARVPDADRRDGRRRKAAHSRAVSPEKVAASS